MYLLLQGRFLGYRFIYKARQKSLINARLRGSVTKHRTPVSFVQLGDSTDCPLDNKEKVGEITTGVISNQTFD